MAAAKLTKYQAMRDFGLTAEPSGKDAKVKPSKALRFVIQKHAATRLHYDLRLELRGASSPGRCPRGRPWTRRTAAWRWRSRTIRSTTATSRGPSPRASTAAARSCCGTAATGRPKRAEKIGAALAKGDLKFVLDGERMHGSWVLVRMKRDSGGKRATGC